MGWFEVLKDWQLVKKQKEGFMAALRMTPPGAGISIKDPGNPVTARAIIEILKENPTSLEVLDCGFEITLMRKVGLAQAVSKDNHAHLSSSYNILNGDAVHKLGLGEALPPKRWRDGVPDDVNTSGGVNTITVKAGAILER